MSHLEKSTTGSSGTAPSAPAATLLMLPGLDGTEVFFRPLVEHLPAWIRPLPLAYPDDGPYGYEALLDEVRTILAGVSDCYVLASSFSGPLAVLLAATEPQKVRGLILSATFLRAPRRHAAALRWGVTTPTVAALRFARRLPVWLQRQRQDAFRRAKRETWSRVSARSLAARGRALLGVDVRHTLQRCPQPLLAVAFSDDRVVARRYVEEIRQHSAAADIVTLPGGHFGLFTHPRPLATEIAHFIDRHRSMPAPI